jgi:hypothetical protein
VFLGGKDEGTGGEGTGGECGLSVATQSIMASMKSVGTIRDNGIQTDKEIQNPVSEHKNNAHALIFFAIRNLYISHSLISKI